MKPSHVLLGESAPRKGRLMNLRPKPMPQKYAIESLQMTSDTGKRNQKSPASTFAEKECTCTTVMTTIEMVHASWPIWYLYRPERSVSTVPTSRSEYSMSDTTSRYGSNERMSCDWMSCARPGPLNDCPYEKMRHA